MRRRLLSRKIIYGDHTTPELNAVICDFVLALLGEPVQFGPCMTLGVLINGELRGAVVFHDYIRSRGTIELTTAANSPHWLSRVVVKEIFKLCFLTNDCQLMFARCDAKNETTSRIMLALGFSKITIPNMRGAGCDEFLFHMTRDMWKQSRYYR